MTNPTLGYLWHRLQGALATSPLAIRRHLVDLHGDPPAQGELFNGQKALLMHAQGPAANLPYYLAQTVLALGLAFAASTAALLCWVVAGPSPWAQALALALAAVAGVCLWQALACRHGPSLIDRDRYAHARASLQRSGDDHARPMHLAMSTAIAFTFLIDGALSGWTVTTEVFGAMLTPRMASVATAVWSLAVAFLLFHMTRAAAEECARNRRRGLVRNLLASPRQADQERAEAIIDAVGARPGPRPATLC
jgi:hypothetical protein